MNQSHASRGCWSTSHVFRATKFGRTRCRWTLGPGASNSTYASAAEVDCDVSQIGQGRTTGAVEKSGAPADPAPNASLQEVSRFVAGYEPTVASRTPSAHDAMKERGLRSP